jgi:hypothetical protein
VLLERYLDLRCYVSIPVTSVLRSATLSVPVKVCVSDRPPDGADCNKIPILISAGLKVAQTARIATILRNCTTEELHTLQPY